MNLRPFFHTALATCLATSAVAQITAHWDPAVTAADFSNAANWLGATPPGDLDNVVLSAADALSPVTVTYDAPFGAEDYYPEFTVNSNVTLLVANDLSIGQLRMVSSAVTLTQTAGTTTIDGPFNLQGGDVAVKGGHFSIDGQLSLGSADYAFDGATFSTLTGGDLTAASLIVYRGTTLSLGTGNVSITGPGVVHGTLALEFSTQATLGDLTIGADYGGTIAGTLTQHGGVVTTGNLDVLGTATLSGGYITGGDLLVRTGGTVNLERTNLAVDNATISGDLTVDRGRLDSGTLALNQSGATFTQTNGTSVITGATTVQAGTTFDLSAGTFRTGSLTTSGGSSSFTQSDGTFTTDTLSVSQAADAVFSLSGGAFNVTGNATISGLGNASGNDFTVSGTTVARFDADLALNGSAELKLSDSASVRIDGAFSTGLLLDENTRITIGAGTSLRTGTANFGGIGKASVVVNGTHQIDGALTLGGAAGPKSAYVIASGGELTTDSFAIAVAAGASAQLDVGGDATITHALSVGSIAGGAGIVKVGTGRLNAGSITVHGSSTFTQNGGTVNVTDTLQNNSTYTMNGAALNAGTVVNTSSFTVNRGLSVNTLTGNLSNSGDLWLNTTLTIDKTSAMIENSGTIHLGSGNELALFASSTLHNTGTIIGSGTVGGVSTDFNDAGILAPGLAVGSMTIVGDYTQLASGHLEIDIGGLVAGTQFDTLRFQNSTPEFYGSLDVSFVNGFAPTLGDTFNIISGQSTFSADFNAINITGLDSTYTLFGESLGNIYRLTVTEFLGGGGSAVPEPSTYALLFGVGALGLAAARRRQRSDNIG